MHILCKKDGGFFMEQHNENSFLLRLIRLEELAGRKANIYAKLLTDQSLADAFLAAANRHEGRAARLAAFARRNGMAVKGGEQ